MNKHTPGPWKCLDDHPQKAVYHIVKKNSNDLDTVYCLNAPEEVATIYRLENSEQNELANARLISSSPSLFELVKHALAVADEGLVPGQKWREEAKAIIRQIEGETE